MGVLTAKKYNAFLQNRNGEKTPSLRNFFAPKFSIKGTEPPSKKYPQSPANTTYTQGIADIFWQQVVQHITNVVTAKKFHNDGVGSMPPLNSVGLKPYAIERASRLKALMLRALNSSHFYKVLSLWLICVVCSPATAQMDSVMLKTVELKANKPQKNGFESLKIDSIALKEYASANLADLLSGNTAIYIKNYSPGGLALPSFRGTGPQHTAIYWNGIPINSSMNSVLDFNLIPIFALDEITVGYGPASLKNGTGGIGGDVALNNKPNTTNGLDISGGAGIGSFGAHKYFGKADYGNGHWVNSTRVYYNEALNDFSFQNLTLLNAPEQTETHASFDNFGIFHQTGFESVNSLFTADLWFHRSFRLIPPAMDVADQGESQYDASLRTAANYTYKAPVYTYNITGGYVRDYLDYINHVDDINSKNYDAEYYLSAGASRVFKEKLKTELGISAMENNAMSQTYHSHSRLTEGLFMNDTFNASPSVLYTVILRQDVVNSLLSPFTFTLALVKEIIPGAVSFRAAAGKNYRNPSLNDLYWFPGGNPNLQTEKSWSGDMGLYLKKRVHNVVFSGNISPFCSYIDNWILWLPANAGYFEAQNLKKVFSYGLETDASVDVKKGKFTWHNKASYSLTYAINQEAVGPNDESVGKQLIYIPQQVFNISSSFIIKSYEAGLNYSINGTRYTTSDNTSYLPPYNLFGVYAVKSFHPLGYAIVLKGRVDNLFNEAYQAVAYRPMPGRYYELILTFNLFKTK